jgi:phospholipase/carboxylesterase
MLDTYEKTVGRNANVAIIWLHGLGATGYDFADLPNDLNLPALFGVHFIFPHAPIQPVTINEGIPMPAWYDIYNLDNTKTEDDAGIIKSQKEIELLIKKQKQSGVSTSRIFLAGFSQGGALALFTGLQHSEKLAGIICLSAYLPLRRKLEKNTDLLNLETPVMLSHGTQDEIIDFRFGEKTRDKLINIGVNLTWKSYDMEHSTCAKQITDIKKFILKCLN